MMTTTMMMTISRPVFTAAPPGNMDAPRQPWLCLLSTLRRLPQALIRKLNNPRGGWPTSPKRLSQEAQRERIAGLAVDDARERAADERDRAADKQV
jgi:hypothetical protein